MSSVDPQAGAGRRILVIEDEFLVADYVAGMLEDQGYEVVGPVSTIADAIATIASEKLDAVLLDANLGGTSSGPIASELTARQVPFVVATGYGNLELATAALQAAPRLNKPFTAAALAAVLRQNVGALICKLFREAPHKWNTQPLNILRSTAEAR